MKKGLLLLVLAGASYAALPTEGDFKTGPSGTGTANYSSAAFPDKAMFGAVFISGDAAIAIFQSMTKVPVQQAVSNLESRKPNEITLRMLERKNGEHIACFNRPEMNKNGFKRDGNGKVIYVMHCVINVSDAATGTIEKSKK